MCWKKIQYEKTDWLCIRFTYVYTHKRYNVIIMPNSWIYDNIINVNKMKPKKNGRQFVDFVKRTFMKKCFQFPQFQVSEKTLVTNETITKELHQSIDKAYNEPRYQGCLRVKQFKFCAMTTPGFQFSKNLMRNFIGYCIMIFLVTSQQTHNVIKTPFYVETSF